MNRHLKPRIYYTCLIMQVASEVVKGAQNFYKYPTVHVDVYYYLLLVIDYILIEVTRRSRLFVYASFTEIILKPAFDSFSFSSLSLQ